jgi:fatty acid desaturase
LIKWRAREHERSRLIFPEKDQTVVKRDHVAARHTQSRPKCFQIFIFLRGLWAFGFFLLRCTPFFILFIICTSPVYNFIFIFLRCNFLF